MKSRMARRWLLRPLAGLAFLLLLACGGLGDMGEPPQGQGEGPGGRAQALALSPEQELDLGERAYAQVLSENRNRVLPKDDRQVKRVRDLAARIVKAAGIEPLQREINLHVKGYTFEWEANVVEEDQVNAFCLPAGKIVVYTGIFKVAQNDDQLATVMSHEIAHALAHHSSERIAREESGRVSLLQNKAYARQQESEADHIGMFLMTFAGYNPDEGVRFWQQMARRAGGGQTPEFLSDHPSDRQRMVAMEAWAPRARAAKKAFDEGNIAPAPGRVR
jgi:metalloendopeptidase OMA1, mitochondrial